MPAHPLRSLCLAIALVACAGQTGAQNIRDYFLSLPYSAAMPLTPAQRSSMLRPEHRPTRGQRAIYQVDFSNGYLSINYSNAEPPHMEICYWKIDGGKQRLIATHAYDAQPCELHPNATVPCTDRIQFYRAAAGHASSLVPVSLQNLGDFPQISDFIDTDRASSPEQKKRIDALGLFYTLPQKGKDIIVSVRPHTPGPLPANLLRRTHIVMQWNGAGGFMRQSALSPPHTHF